MPPGRTARGFAACALVAALAAGAHAARAGEGPASAEALLQEGRRLLADGKLDEACPKLAEAQKLAPSATTALAVGDCFARAGKSASALAAFDEARALAAHAAGEAERRMKEIEARQPRVVLSAPGGLAPGTTIRLDGVPIDPAAVNAPIPLEPGLHLVETSRGGTTWRARVQVEPSGTASVPLPGPPPDATAPAPPPSPPPPPPAAPPPAATPPPPTAPKIPWEGHRISGIALGVAGGVGLIVGTVLGVRAITEKRASNAGPCNAADYCDSTGRALRADAMRAGNAATVSLFAGGALVASGVALFLTAPTARGSRVGLSAGPGDVRLVGRW